MESCAPGLTKWNLFLLFFPSQEKLYSPVCSIVPASLQARGHRPRDCTMGLGRAKREGDFSVLGKKNSFQLVKVGTHFSFVSLLSTFIKKYIFEIPFKILAADTFKATLPTHYKLDYEHDINLGLA